MRRGSSSSLPWAVLAGLLTSRAGAELLYTPPIFEDFAGPDLVRLDPRPARGLVTGRWKLLTLVPAGEMGDGALVIHRLGLRADEAAEPPPSRLRGAVTLSTTHLGSLRPRFAENAGDAPVSFFGEARTRGGGQPLFVFDLPGGFRYDPQLDGNLVVHLEIQAAEALTLDAAPGGTLRLVVAADPLAAAGEGLSEALVLMMEVERERPLLLSPSVSRSLPETQRREKAKPPRPAPARPAPRGPAPTPGELLLAEKVQSLERRVAALNLELESIRQAGERVNRRVEDGVRAVAGLIERRYVEDALESGVPGPSLLAASRDLGGPRLEDGRAAIVGALGVALSAGFDVRTAQQFLDQGDERLARGDRGLAFVSYSLAYRSVMSVWRPFAVPPREPPLTPPAILAAREIRAPASAAPRRWRSPYDVASDYPVR